MNVLTHYFIASLLFLSAVTGSFLPQRAYGQDIPALAENAPAHYTVVKGDTLWGIAERFLVQPWRWPEIWERNKQQIANPNLIYPGDEIYIDHANGRASLNLLRGGNAPKEGFGDHRNTLDPGTLQTVKWTPKDRGEQVPVPVPTIPPGVIEPFLSKPIALDQSMLNSPARIVDTQEGRVYLGKGDTAYAIGLPEDGEDFAVYRPTRPILDPDSRQPIAWEAEYAGVLRRIRKGEPATLQVISSTREIGRGDRLLPVEPAEVPHWMPHAPNGEVAGKIVGVYGGVRQAGRHSVVTLNIGKLAGLEPGHVLALKQTGGLSREKNDQGQPVRLPDERVGEVFIFRVFDRIAYGLVVSATGQIGIGDTVNQP